MVSLKFINFKGQINQLNFNSITVIIRSDSINNISNTFNNSAIINCSMRAILPKKFK